jgi:hypothetical protein
MNLPIIGTYPDTAIDHEQVLISRGPLPPAKNGSAAVNSDGNIHFSWEDNSETGTAKPDSKVVLFAYFPQKKRQS